MIVKIRKLIYRITKKTGDKLGIDLPYLVENGFWVVLNQSVTSLMAFVFFIFTARFLTKEVLGEYQLMLSILGVLSIASLPGLNVSVSRSVANGFEKSYGKAVKLSLKWSLLSIPAFAGLSVWYYLNDNLNFAILMILCGLFFYQIFGFNTWTSYWQGKAKFEKYAKQQVFQTITLYSMLILALIFFSNYLLIISVVYLIITSTFNTIWHKLVLNQINKNSNEDAECIPYGKYMSKINLLSIIVNHFDKIIIGFFDIELLAVYIIAIKFFDTIKEFVRNIHNISFPKFAKKEISISAKQIALLLCAGFIATIMLYLFAAPIVNFFFTEKYAASISIFKKLIIVLPLVFVSPLFAYKANANKEKKKIFRTYILAPLIALIISSSVFLFSKNPEMFVISKVYVLQITYFIILVPFSRKPKT